MKVRSVAGVLVGGILDILATNVFALPVVMYAVVKYHLVGSEGAQTLARTVSSDPSLAVPMWFMGAAASVLGGYAAAWIARRSELLIGALSAYFCVALGVVSLAHDASGALLVHLAGFVVSPALGALGGYLRLMQTRRAVRA